MLHLQDFSVSRRRSSPAPAGRSPPPPPPRRRRFPKSGRALEKIQWRSKDGMQKEFQFEFRAGNFNGSVFGALSATASADCDLTNCD
jgi:hypothetical protein